jgi:hypothetical protein
LLDPASQVLTSEVCHIEADSPNGPRYNENQNDAERQGFANLVILCSNHHKIVDTDVATWTVSRLIDLKKNHEAGGESLPDPPDELVRALGATVSIGHVMGSVITTFNQSGGQVAHQIVNEGEPRRRPSQASLGDLANRLAPLPKERFFISAPTGYSEAHRLAETLYAALKNAGWTTRSDGPGQLMGASPPVPPGVHFCIDRESPSARAFAQWCMSEGLSPTFYVGPLPGRAWPDTVDIVVGPAPER